MFGKLSDRWARIPDFLPSITLVTWFQISIHVHLSVFSLTPFSQAHTIKFGQLIQTVFLPNFTFSVKFCKALWLKDLQGDQLTRWPSTILILAMKALLPRKPVFRTWEGSPGSHRRMQKVEGKIQNSYGSPQNRAWEQQWFLCVSNVD